MAEAEGSRDRHRPVAAALRGLIAGCRSARRLADDVLADLPARAGDAPGILAELLGQPPDLVVRALRAASVVYLETVVDQRRLEDHLIRPLMQGQQVRSGHLRPLATYGAAAQALLSAEVVLVRDGRLRAASMDSWPKRDPDEPPAEVVPQGPHQGFVENLNTNMALLRHRVRDRHLRCDRFALGTRSHGHGLMVYLDGAAREDLVAAVRRRLRSADPSYAVDAAMLQEWLSNRSGWLFPTIAATERPDTAAAALLDGRVVILVDGSPTCLMMPCVFFDLLHTPEDYYNRAFDAVLKRSLRFVALIMSLTISPLYVALSTVNQDLLPVRLYVSFAQSRLGVPLPTVVEVLVMEVMVEMVREAGLRMPSAMGQTISIVGAIVIGQSAVMAGLISAPVVVVVALSYIASTTVPTMDARVALRALRFPMILLAAFFGLFGVVWGLMVLLVYLLGLRSFGVPYLAPLAPRRPRGLQDVILRRPLTDMRLSFFSRRGAGEQGRRPRRGMGHAGPTGAS